MATREAGPGRVLVVEDDESTALFITKVLSRNGFEAAWVMSAEHASERLDGESFDVLLADYRLPGRSGMDLARDARLATPGIGIAVMTSFAEYDTEMTARDSGADDFFEKPLHPSNFLTRIGDLVARSRAFGLEMSLSPAQETGGALPPAPILEVSPNGATFGVPRIAGSGSDERVVPRDTASAPSVPAATRDGGYPGSKGTDGYRRTRSSALSNPGGDQ